MQDACETLRVPQKLVLPPSSIPTEQDGHRDAGGFTAGDPLSQSSAWPAWGGLRSPPNLLPAQQEEVKPYTGLI